MSAEAQSQENEDWRQTREKVLKRDGYECRFCGMTEEEHQEETDRSLDVHHIIPKSDGGEDRMHNLAALCRSCHSTMESLHGQAMEEIVNANDHARTLEGLNRVFNQGWNEVHDLENALAEFIEGHPVFKDRFGLYDEGSLAEPDQSAVACHEWQEVLPTNTGEGTLSSEWEFAVLWGYKEGVLETICDLDGWTDVPFEEFENDE